IAVPGPQLRIGWLMPEGEVADMPKIRCGKRNPADTITEPRVQPRGLGIDNQATVATKPVKRLIKGTPRD
ncbi:MAG TPA: hypothetical protein VJ837_06455, partial [Candidatus Paceibacterota bacterium]|nr:hypothetical protein [Candidatus Paceibacterota bacterium]